MRSLKRAMADYERGYIILALHRNDMNRGRTAEMLGISLATLHRKMARHRIYEEVGKQGEGADPGEIDALSREQDQRNPVLSADPEKRTAGLDAAPKSSKTPG